MTVSVNMTIILKCTPEKDRWCNINNLFCTFYKRKGMCVTALAVLLVPCVLNVRETETLLQTITTDTLGSVTQSS